MRPHFLLCLGLLSGIVGCGRAPTPAPWSEYAATASLSTNTILIGQPVDLRLTIDHPADVTVRLPALDDQASPIMVRDQSQAAEDLAADERRTVVDYRITSFTVGDHVISSNQLVFARNGQDIHSNLFPFVSLQVQSALTNDQAFAADKDLARWPPGVPRLVTGILVVGALAFLIAGAVAWLILRRGIRFAPAPPIPPAHLTALDAIERLKRKNYIEQELREPFYVELSDIIRHYIEQRFGIHAPDQTTEEFMVTAMNSRLLAPAPQLLTRQFLEQCDLVKFARARPGVDDMRAALGVAEELVQQTRISEEAVAA